MAGQGSWAKVASDRPKPPLRPEATSFQNRFSALDGRGEELVLDRGRERSNACTPNSGNPAPNKAVKPSPLSPHTPVSTRASEGDLGARLTAVEVQLAEVLAALRRGSNAGASSSNPHQAVFKEVEEINRRMRRCNVMVHGVKMEQFDKYSDEVWDGLEKLCKTKGIKYAYLFEPSRRDGGSDLGATPRWAEARLVHRDSAKGTVVLCLTGLSHAARGAVFRLKQLAREEFGWGIDDDLTPLQRQQRGLRRSRMEELRQRGVKPSWRGSDVVWWDTKAARWAVEVFETSTSP